MHKFIILSLLLYLYSCKNPQAQQQENHDNTTSSTGTAMPVTVTTIKQQTFNKQIISNGKIEALKKTDLRFKTQERINTINTKNGQYVTQGKLLATLDNNLLKNELKKAEIELNKAKAKLEEEKINFNSQDTTLTPQILNNLKIKSGYYEAENNLQNTQIRYNQTLLKAPFSGTIANIKTKEGDYITPSEVFCTLISNKNMQVQFSILETDLPFITKNQTVTLTPFSDPQTTYTATISEINPVVDKNGLIQIKATINNPDPKLIDGLNVKTIINHPVENVIVIPKQAVVLRSNREVVFTLQDSLAKWKYIEILYENTTSYAIKKGLKPTDSVIISGNINLAHDAKVNPTFVQPQTNSDD